MTHFILILAFLVERGGAVDHVEYDSKPACEAARAVIWQSLTPGWSRNNLTLVCTPKG